MTGADESQATLRVRTYEESDEAAVAALWREVFPGAPQWNVPEDDMRLKLTVQRELFLVATLGPTLVGTVMGGFDGHRGWVHLLAVHPVHRRNGIGAALMRRVEHDLAAIECSKVNLQIRAGNETVVAFYTGLGYSVEERVSMGKRL